MENYTIDVKYKPEEFIEDEDEIDYSITITISTIDGIKLFKSNFSSSSLGTGKKCYVPEEINGEWRVDVYTESVNQFYIKKYRSTPESPYYVSFTSTIDSANHISHVTVFKYTEAIDEMLIKLREIYMLYTEKN